MNLAVRLFIPTREIVVRRWRGQTMTEYALILAAVGMVVWAAYSLMGQNISNMSSGVDSDLLSA